MTLPHTVALTGAPHTFERDRDPSPGPQLVAIISACACASVHRITFKADWRCEIGIHFHMQRAASRSGSVVLPHIHAWTVGPQYVDPRNVCNVGSPLATGSPNPFHPAEAMRTGCPPKSYEGPVTVCLVEERGEPDRSESVP